MRKTTVVRLHGIKFIDAINQNNTLILMLFAVLLGIFLGALKIKNGDTDFLSAVTQNFASYISVRNSDSFLSSCLKATFIWLPFILSAFLCGTSLAGMAMVPVIIGYFGYNYGVLSAYLYSVYSISGIGFCMLLIIPARAIAAFSLILAGRESFGFSLMMAKITLQSKKAVHAYYDFKNYCLRYLFILLILVFSTLVDCMFFMAFGKFFSF